MHIIISLIILIGLSIFADVAFYNSLKRAFTAQLAKRMLWVTAATNIYLIAFIVALFIDRSMVTPAPIWTLTALVIFVPKVFFMILWIIFVLPIYKLRLATWTFFTVGAMSVFIGAVIFHGGIWGRKQIEVNRLTITSPRLPASFDGYRIAQISDFHLGSLTIGDTTFVNNVVDSILNLKPDVICFTGDLVNRRANEIVPFIKQLQRLRNRRHKVYAVLGNHDYSDYNKGWTNEQKMADTDSLRYLIKKVGWRLLDNRGEFIRHRSYRHKNDSYNKNHKIQIVGVGNIGEPPFSTYGDLREAMEGMDANGTFTILLSHNPIHWRQEVLPYTCIDLMLAGHTHGMQMQLGNFSPASWKYNEWSGLYKEGDQYLNVNTGLGTVGVPIRIGMNPEITLITLKCPQ